MGSDCPLDGRLRVAGCRMDWKICAGRPRWAGIWAGKRQIAGLQVEIGAGFGYWLAQSSHCRRWLPAGVAAS